MKLRFGMMAAALALSVPALAQTKWDLPAAYPATNFHSVNLEQFAKDVDKATGGKLKITVHPNASLYKAPEIKRAVQQGQAQIGEILLVNFQNEWQIFGADGIPFLATSYDESMKLYQAQKPLLQKKLDEQGMMLLYTVAWPPQGIYTKRTLNSAADMKGLKWRAYSPATARVAELVGAQPVTVQAAELSQAMATGVVDSYMSSGSTGYDTKTYEHIKNWYDTQAWLPKNAVIVNKAAFNALDKATQDALVKAAAEAEARGWNASKPQVSQQRDVTAEGQTYILGQGPPLPAGADVTFVLSGLPHAPVWPRNIALALAVLVLAFGAYTAVRGPFNPPVERERLESDRERLFAELTALEESHRAGRVPPHTYASRRREIVRALEGVYAALEETAAA